MKKIAAIFCLMSISLSAFAEVQTSSDTFTFNCNSAKIFCYCPMRLAYHKAMKDAKVCGDKEIKFLGTDIEKSFSDGGDQMTCTYTAAYDCK